MSTATQPAASAPVPFRPTLSGDDGEWRIQAACRNLDTELFYSEDPTDTRRAIAICGRCPVRAVCFQYAMNERELHGVWGGTDEAYRRRIVRRERRERAKRRREVEAA